MITQLLIVIACLLVLGFIFVRRYLMVEKGITLKSVFFRQKNIFRHREEEDKLEITVEEMIPNSKEVDDKMIAKADSLIKKAEIVLKKGKPRDSEKMLIQAIAADPSSVEAYRKLGMLYLQQSQYGKAESIYKKLVLTITDEPVLFSNLALSLYHQKKLEEAKGHYKRAIEIDDSRAARFFSLANILYELQEFDEALNHFKAAVAKDSGNIDYNITLAHFYVERAMIEDAKLLVEEILKIDPENAEAQAIMQSLGSN
ncbi:tetratricopeptide repeat protein [Candidatus Peregrinibacteria bacterium]|nr:tetratricopeptide repeat protein [Candidatus Peregrinibacteria bacterium]